MIKYVESWMFIVVVVALVAYLMVVASGLSNRIEALENPVITLSDGTEWVTIEEVPVSNGPYWALYYEDDDGWIYEDELGIEYTAKVQYFDEELQKWVDVTP